MEELGTSVAKKQDKLTNPLTSSDVVYGVTSTDTTKPLAAAQGKVLNEKVEAAIACKNFSVTATIAAGAAQDITGNAESGDYGPIGIAQFDTGNTNAVIEKVNVSANTLKAYFRVKNTGTSSIAITLKYTVLYASKKGIFKYLTYEKERKKRKWRNFLITPALLWDL